MQAETFFQEAIEKDSIVAFFEYMRLVPDTMEADIFSNALVSGARNLATYLLITDQVPNPLDIEAQVQQDAEPQLTLADLSLSQPSIFNMLKDQQYMGFLASSPETITSYLTLLQTNNPNFVADMDTILDQALEVEDIAMSVDEARQTLASGQQISNSQLLSLLAPFL